MITWEKQLNCNIHQKTDSVMWSKTFESTNIHEEVESDKLSERRKPKIQQYKSRDRHLNGSSNSKCTQLKPHLAPSQQLHLSMLWKENKELESQKSYKLIQITKEKHEQTLLVVVKPDARG
jgi:hypothetical protein